jgi:hypothetical protein
MHGDICTLCCGTEREVTVDCPFDCPFLQEARKHEHTGPVKPDELPNKDIRITEDFLEEHEPLLVGAMSSLALAVFDTPGAVDSDVRDALDALIRTERTLQSGVYYETRPANALANHIFSETHKGLAEFRKRESEKLGMTHTRDADVLGVLVFLQRLELDRNNGRPRGRAFLDSLRGFLGDVQGAIPQGPPQYSPLILP